MTSNLRLINAFSVDLEDWFEAVTSLNAHPERWGQYEPRVEANTLRLLDLLEEYDIRATFFVLGIVAKTYPDLIRRIDAAGHEIGVHGHLHTNIHRFTPDEFSRELDQALEAITPLIHQPILGHRAPYFSINERNLWALDILLAKGFRYDSSFFATYNMLYGYPKSPLFPHHPENLDLVEFPVSSVRWGRINWPVAGGFYLRFYPYSVTRWAYRKINQDGRAVVMYIHPWELDAAHCYRKVTPREYLVQYTGRNTTEEKLRHLFRDFSFAPIRTLFERFPQTHPATVEAGLTSIQMIA